MLAQQCEALNGTESYALKWFLVRSMDFTSVKVEQRVREGVEGQEGRVGQSTREALAGCPESVFFVLRIMRPLCP